MGQKRLSSAIASFREMSVASEINVEWKPYIIDRGTNINGEDFEAYNRRRWGSSGWTNHLKLEGLQDGANFANWNWWPNTMKAHCLVKFAKERYNVETGKSNAAIFHALYEEGKNISLIDTLVAVGKDNLGLPEDELRQYLEAGEGEHGVNSEIRTGRNMYNISGVPFFVIDKADGGDGRPYGLSGAQSANTFLSVFKELLE